MLNKMLIRKNKSNKSGQVWTLDFIIGLILFVLILIISLKILFNMYSSSDDLIAYRDAVHLSDNLLSVGYPSNWTYNLTTVVLPGISENNRINITKLEKFNEVDYYRAKTLMHVTSDYIFFIRNSTVIINTGHCIYGYNVATDAECNPLLSTLHYNNLARIDRVIIYNSTIMLMTVYTWN
jgi:hypothetical protein